MLIIEIETRYGLSGQNIYFNPNDDSSFNAGDRISQNKVVLHCIDKGTWAIVSSVDFIMGIDLLKTWKKL